MVWGFRPRIREGTGLFFGPGMGLGARGRCGALQAENFRRCAGLIAAGESGSLPGNGGDSGRRLPEKQEAG